MKLKVHNSKVTQYSKIMHRSVKTKPWIHGYTTPGYNLLDVLVVILQITFCAKSSPKAARS